MENQTAQNSNTKFPYPDFASTNQPTQITTTPPTPPEPDIAEVKYVAKPTEMPGLKTESSDVGILPSKDSAPVSSAVSTLRSIGKAPDSLNDIMPDFKKPKAMVREPKANSLAEPISEEEVTKGQRYPFLRYAAIFVLGLGITSSVGYSIYQKQIDDATLLVETSVQKKVQNKIQEATFFIESPIPTVTLSVKTNPKKEVVSFKYHIMAGAYRSEVNANKELKELKKLGYDAKRIPENKNGLYPVVYGSYATFAEAQKAQKEIIEDHNPDAWILIQSL